MCLALITVLADESGQMQIGNGNVRANFFLCFATRADIRRFADVRFQLATARAPIATIRLLRTLQQQHFIALIETIEQRCDFVR